MRLMAEPFNIACHHNGDWPKETWDLRADNVEDVRAEIESLRWTIEDFKTLPAYASALASGNYPWLKDL